MSGEGIEGIGSGQAERRARWELDERIAELQWELAERTRREEQRDAEVLALRHELELRATQDAAREERIAIADSGYQLLRGDHEWLKQHLAEVTRQFGEERAELVAASRTAEAEAQVRHERERAADGAVLAALRARVGDLEAALEVAERTLADERARLSYRVAQKATGGPLARRALTALHRDPS